MTSGNRMADDQEKARVEELTARIQALTETVDQLSARLSQSSSATVDSTPPASDTPVEKEFMDLSLVTEEILDWAGKSSLLPRISTLCFLLVVALGLRTLTDNNIIETLLGSALGMGYAALLILTGWFGYARGNPLAPVFAACGAALMAIIVVETHTRFQSLPLVPAYLTLMATGVGTALISYRYNVLAPISFGTLGMCLAGAAMGLPRSSFSLPVDDPLDSQYPRLFCRQAEALHLAALVSPSGNFADDPSLGCQDYISCWNAMTRRRRCSPFPGSCRCWRSSRRLIWLWPWPASSEAANPGSPDLIMPSRPSSQSGHFQPPLWR